MATNKNAFIRYKILDNCFRNTGKRYFIDDLIEECNKALFEIDVQSNGISRRQIFEDINFMSSDTGWGIELKKHRIGKKVYYRYCDPTFSINNMPLNEIEINYLKDAINILSQFKGTPQFEWIRDLIPKLNQGLNIDNSNQTIIHFDSNPYLKGIDFLTALHHAIFYKKVLLFEYQPFESEIPLIIEVHPYYLKQYNNRWFLYGYNPESDRSDWNLALDRINKFEEISKKYKLNEIINWEDYFEDIIGVSKPLNGVLEKIRLHFFGKTGKYITSKPIHGSQISKWISETTLEVNLNLIINYEFEQFILSYGESVKVIYPQSFADSVADRLSNALHLYS